jgi:hypothetical protein
MTTPRSDNSLINGAIMAAILSAGIGAFAVGFVVILNEAGIFTAPALYGPAGGVSGRTTIAAMIWLVAWFILHARWKSRHVEPRTINLVTLLLIFGGIVLTFPPVWGLFG